MENDILIATYSTPDLDGFACGYALEEFFKAKKIRSKFILFGTISSEVQYLINELNIVPPPSGISLVTESSKIILVDASETNGLDELITLGNVIEVIDHRRFYDETAFYNASYNIEFVGAAATLITEKFINQSIPITVESSTLLYYAIISNTINFNAKVTTERDVRACEWLYNNGNLIKDLTYEMFKYKSKEIKVSEDFFTKNYISFPNLNGHLFGIIQIEIIDAYNFIEENYEKLIFIEASIKKERKLNFFFYTFVDIVNIKNFFLTSDYTTQLLLKKSLLIHSFNKRGIGEYNGILMRKEIVPKINEYLK